jgi:hypothetical protein
MKRRTRFTFDSNTSPCGARQGKVGHGNEVLALPFA